MNRTDNVLQLVAKMVERSVLRYTPAGIPIVSAILQHRSELMEAGIKRLIEFEIAALGIGQISENLNHAVLGDIFRFTGFMARKSRSARSLVFHITDFTIVDVFSENSTLKD